MVDYTIIGWTILVVSGIPFAAIIIDIIRITLILQLSIAKTDSYFRQLYELEYKDDALMEEIKKLDAKRKSIAEKYSLPTF